MAGGYSTDGRAYAIANGNVNACSAPRLARMLAVMKATNAVFAGQGTTIFEVFSKLAAEHRSIKSNKVGYCND